MFTFADGATEKKGSYTIRKFGIPHTSVSYFNITGGLDSAVAEKVNALLDEEALSLAEGECSCTSPLDMASYSSEVVHTFFGPHVISVVTNIAYDCGGPHPDEALSTLNINTATGELLELGDVLCLLKGIEGPDVQHSDDYAEQLIGLLKRLFPAHMKAGASGEGCDYTDQMCWQYASWYFTSQGLHLSPSFPHIVAECADEEWSTIPYSEVKKYPNPKKKITLP